MSETSKNAVPDRFAPFPRSAKRRPSGWTLGAILIAAVVLLPIGSVIWMAFFPDENIWPHLIRTTLPRYLGNTIGLTAAVGAVSACIGTGAAWLVVMYEFRGKYLVEWALLLPLAVPAYVGAYGLVDFLEYAGPVQTGLRQLAGWQDSRDYWFPEIRSFNAAVLVLSASLYPYVYILVRAGLREMSGAGFEVSRALGAGPWRRFWKIGLPLSRPAIVAGTSVVMMETVNDFGTVDFFAVQTLTTGIFSLWQQSGNLGGAAQIACMILTIIVLLVSAERLSRRRKRFFGSARGQRPVQSQRLSPAVGGLALGLCLIPIAMGFILPTSVMVGHALRSDAWLSAGLGRAFLHTITTGGAAAFLCVAGGVFMVYGVRISGKRIPQLLMPVTAIGYAAPGAVLGLGILIPLAGLDNRIADLVLRVTGTDPGLFLTGTSAAVILAYSVRFFAIAQGTADAAMARVPQSLPMAARSLGLTAGETLRRVHVPMIQSSLGSALLLVFVDCVKELPATLMLRPFGYDTLATRVHAKASLENLTDASPAALIICAVGLLAVTLLARTSR